MSGRRYVAFALIAMLALAACSGDPEPRVESTPASSTAGASAPSESSSPAAGKVPKSAREFITRWVTLYMKLQSTGSSRALERVSVGCEACQDTVQRYSQIYAKGGVIRGGVITITKLELVDRSKAAETWIATFEVTSTRYRETATADWQRLAGGEIAFRFVLTADDGRYNVSELYQESV